MKKAFENTVGKGENAGNHHFLLFFTQDVLYIPRQIPFPETTWRQQILSLWRDVTIRRLAKKPTYTVDCDRTA